MYDVMDYEELAELYYDGNDLVSDSYGMSVYNETQLDWALEDSRYNVSVVDEEGGEY